MSEEVKGFNRIPPKPVEKDYTVPCVCKTCGACWDEHRRDTSGGWVFNSRKTYDFCSKCGGKKSLSA